MHMGVKTDLRQAGGRNLYLTAEGRLLRGRPTRSSSVIVLRRRADTGAMQPLGGPRGCLTLLAVADCSRARAIDFPVGVMVSPDGRFVYTAASSSRGAAIFARDRQSGALRQLPGRRGCLRHPPGAELCAYRDLGKGVNSGFREWSQLSPDGRFVYGFDRPLRRDVRRGGLSPTGDNGCRLPCRPGTLAFAPGARDVYLLSYDRYAVHGLRINRRTGALARMPRAPRCWPAGVAGCGEVLGEVANIGIAPDGRHVYVTLGVRDVVIRFTRRANGLLSRGIVQPVCGGRSTGSPCPAVTLGGLEDVVFAPDGRRAYAMLGDAVVAHSRDRHRRRTHVCGVPRRMREHGRAEHELWAGACRCRVLSRRDRQSGRSVPVLADVRRRGGLSPWLSGAPLVRRGRAMVRQFLTSYDPPAFSKALVLRLENFWCLRPGSRAGVQAR
jgi:hypothetical protein